MRVSPTRGPERRRKRPETARARVRRLLAGNLEAAPPDSADLASVSPRPVEWSEKFAANGGCWIIPTSRSLGAFRSIVDRSGSSGPALPSSHGAGSVPSTSPAKPRPRWTDRDAGLTRAEVLPVDGGQPRVRAPSLREPVEVGECEGSSAGSLLPLAGSGSRSPLGDPPEAKREGGFVERLVEKGNCSPESLTITESCSVIQCTGTVK